MPSQHSNAPDSTEIFNITGTSNLNRKIRIAIEKGGLINYVIQIHCFIKARVHIFTKNETVQIPTVNNEHIIQINI